MLHQNDEDTAHYVDLSLIHIFNMSACAGKEAEPEPEETEQPPEEEQGGGMVILLFVLLVAAAGGGAFYYFKILKPKKDAAKGSSSLDAVSYTHLDVYKRQEVHFCPLCGRLAGRCVRHKSGM